MIEVNEMMRERTATGRRWIDQTGLHSLAAAPASERHACAASSFDLSWSKQA